MEIGRSEGGEKNEKDERRERVIRLGKWGLWGLGFFFSLNINGRAGGYPLDKIHKTRGPPETRIREIIKIRIRPLCTHGRAAGRTGRAILSGGSVFTGFCPPLITCETMYEAIG